MSGSPLPPGKGRLRLGGNNDRLVNPVSRRIRLICGDEAKQMTGQRAELTSDLPGAYRALAGILAGGLLYAFAMRQNDCTLSSLFLLTRCDGFAEGKIFVVNAGGTYLLVRLLYPALSAWILAPTPVRQLTDTLFSCMTLTDSFKFYAENVATVEQKSRFYGPTLILTFTDHRRAVIPTTFIVGSEALTQRFNK